ncbi:MAG: hypothetical protein PHQ75_04180 [Thermoguttaceae bacterium]|nr:hypothetical protein [Thermoguttaceae bacterium]
MSNDPIYDDNNENNEQEDFFYRVFGRKPVMWTRDELQNVLDENSIPLMAIEAVDEEDADDLESDPSEIMLSDPEGNIVALLEFDDLETSTMLPDELDEFRDMIDDYKPAANRDWLLKFFDQVTCCYVFTMLDNAFDQDHWEALAQLTDLLRMAVDGIEQSDSGPITNEEGDIVLDMPDDDDDQDAYDWLPCRVALQENEQWNSFEVQSVQEYKEFLNRK